MGLCQVVPAGGPALVSTAGPTRPANLRRVSASDRGGSDAITVSIFDTGDRVLLRQCVERLSQDFGAEPCERFDGGDQVFWDFVLAGTQLTLHWERAAGISVVIRESRSGGSELARRIVEHLQRSVTPG